ncbi:hypothetical protein [uncultured Duncaniella sp.]|uniref:hypothetical protein n=1 Tax=uncultured Duncaniella sp. TaxID=2768039 RepID=UPI00259C80E3|nr:hypothetical protein [uncultured Duncaniella sp.]
MIDVFILFIIENDTEIFDFLYGIARSSAGDRTAQSRVERSESHLRGDFCLTFADIRRVIERVFGAGDGCKGKNEGD